MSTPFKIGGCYNWKHQSERLIYMGHKWSGNGYWHRFAKVESPDGVWCEVLTSDLTMLEETAQEPTSAVPVVEQLVEALKDAQRAFSPVIHVGVSSAIAAGQKFIKENGK